MWPEKTITGEKVAYFLYDSNFLIKKQKERKSNLMLVVAALWKHVECSFTSGTPPQPGTPPPTPKLMCSKERTTFPWAGTNADTLPTQTDAAIIKKTKFSSSKVHLHSIETELSVAVHHMRNWNTLDDIILKINQFEAPYLLSSRGTGLAGSEIEF